MFLVIFQNFFKIIKINQHLRIQVFNQFTDIIILVKIIIITYKHIFISVVPTVIVSTFFYNPSIGDTITLSCSVQALGSVYSVTWYFNSIPILNIGRYSGGIYGSPSLTISNIQSSDTGSYICSAATSAGSRNGSTISVNVQQVIPTVLAPTAFYQPRVGDQVTLDCSVTASGQPYTVTWYYNNAFIFTNSGRYSGAISGNPSLTISNVQTSDTGSYICSATTSGGSRNSSAITVSVQQGKLNLLSLQCRALAGSYLGPDIGFLSQI